MGTPVDPLDGATSASADAAEGNQRNGQHLERERKEPRRDGARRRQGCLRHCRLAIKPARPFGVLRIGNGATVTLWHAPAIVAQGAVGPRT